ncbi:hypothetical protein DRB06_11835 [Actinomyces sp. Z5]|uniref:ROK family transcriptional regulator n=1 Tax=Actinomyces sp. Z5 TaxID=2250216 RepID=UPI000DCB8FCE|nr:ROK family transcriptional regulator [Actinomyces sp. Z5]RAX19667.1 hypothetical protein DRB06_11835 [Actinomyces sp. Z5]
MSAVEDTSLAEPRPALAGSQRHAQRASIGRGDPGVLRRWNEYAVLTALRESSPQRASQLRQTTGLTVATLGTVLRDLQSKGWVAVGTSAQGAKGRPAQTYSLRVPSGCVLGLDVGAHVVRAQCLDLDGKELAQSEIRLTAGREDDERDVAARQVVEQALRGAQCWSAVLAVGGFVEEDGTLVESAAIPSWNGTRPLERFESLLGPGCLIVNDVCASVYAERCRGAASGYDDVLLLQTGRRPTLGIMHGGRLRHGAHGMAGDLSADARVPTEHRPGGLGELSEGADALGRAVREASTGDQVALGRIRRLMEGITPALVTAVAIDDPELVVVAGALTPVAHLFLDDIRAALAAGVRRPPKVVVSANDQFSSAQGAALLALNRVRSNLASHDGVQPFTREAFLAQEHRPGRALV